MKSKHIACRDEQGRLTNETYLKRFILWTQRLYIHKFLGSDKVFHDHPFYFLTFTLWGEYEEFQLNPTTGEKTSIIRKAGKFIYRKPTDIHMIKLIDNKPCWTVCLVLKRTRPWGFWVKIRNRYKWIKSNLFLKDK